MSTRAIYTFTDELETAQPVHVYKHFDGYPTGAAECIQETIDSHLAWQLPRYEPDEFASAFIAANKKGPGDFRIVPQNVAPHNFAGDAAYHYVITQTQKNHVLMVHAFITNFWDENPIETRIISCSQEAFERHAKEYEKSPAAYEKAHNKSKAGSSQKTMFEQ